MQIVNYPQGWIDRFLEDRLFATDLIHRESRAVSDGFCWSDVDQMITLSAGDQAVLANGRDAGIGNGFTIPAIVPGETNRFCSFAMADGQELESEQLPLVQIVGAFAFESARRLARPTLRPDNETSRLAVRQLECVVLMAGISPRVTSSGECVRGESRS